MKILSRYTILICISLLAVSCEKGLEDLNKNKTNPTTLDPVLLLNNAIINTS